MKPKHIRTGAILLIAAGVIIALLGARKTVTIDIDGASRQLQTYALTAGQALRDAGEPVAEEDRMLPSPADWIKNGDTIILEHAAVIMVQADGETHTLVSAERVPSNILEGLGIALGPGDQVESGGNAIALDQPLPPAPSYWLQVQRALPLSVNNEGDEFLTTASNLAEAFWEQGITVYEADRQSSQMLAPLEEILKEPGISLDALFSPSRPVTVHTLDGTVSFRTAAATVGEALAEVSLAPQGLDYSQPAQNDPVPPDGEIRLVRVEEHVLIEQTPLPFETEYQPDPNTDLDSQSVLQHGEYGLNSTRVRVRYEDGVEVGRTTEAAWVSRPPVNQVVGYGTNVVMRTITTSDGVTIEYWRAIQMWATSYRPLETSNTTASGLPLQKGVCAIDRRYIPFYTQMYIPGYGNCVAADVGGGVIGRWIDLGYSNEDYQSWHHWVTVYFLWPPPAFIAYIFP